MALDAEELERYARHILLREVGGPGQQKLKGARVLVVGAGGLGSPLLLYLAAAGVGTLGIVDDDVVALSNLQRQIVHATSRIGEPKTLSASVALHDVNPLVAIEPHQVRLDAGNALDIVGRYDLVADGSDRIETRYLVSDACFLAGKTLVSAAVGQFDGQVATFRPRGNAPGGNPWPTYRCLYPEAPPPGTIPTCEEAGILGALTGVVGSLQAIEVLKELLGIGDSLAGKLLMYDALSARTYVTKLTWDPENPLNGRNSTIHDLSHLG